MRTIWQALAWKEWHEHKWKLAALVTVLCGACALVLWLIYPDRRQDLFDAIYWMATCCTIPLALFIGAGAATGERSRGTEPFAQALPVSSRWIAAYKLVAGLLTLFVSILCAYAFVFVACQLLRASGYLREIPYSPSMTVLPRSIEFGNWFVSRGTVTALVAGSIYLWTAAAGVERQDEGSATALAGLLIVLWWLGVFGLSRLFDHQWLWTDGWWIATAVQSASPGGIGVLTLPESRLLPTSIFGVPASVPAGGLFHLALAYWSITRYGQVLGRLRSPQTALASVNKADWLGPPRQSPLTAIAWKQCRESGPVVAAGFAGILAICLAAVALVWHKVTPPYAVDALLSLSMIVGLLVSLVIGIGTFLSDVSPPLNEFWLSRPINPDSWFWTKIATNTVILEAPVVGVLIFFLAFGGIPSRDVIEFAVLVLLAPLWVFTAAALLICLVRHAVYAVILGLAAMYAGFLILLGIYWTTQAALGHVQWQDRVELTNREAAGIIAVLIAVYTILAWLAVRMIGA